MAELLLELYSEEIPPQSQIGARSQLKQFIENSLREDNNILFLEINPRLTTSFIGLRETMGINPFGFFNDSIIDYDITKNSSFTLNITNEK